MRRNGTIERQFSLTLKDSAEVSDRWSGRQTLIEQQSVRAEGSKKIQDVL